MQRVYDGPRASAVQKQTSAAEDPEVRVIFALLLVLTGAPSDWRKLTRFTRVNKTAVCEFGPETAVASPCFWELGHQVERTGNGIRWVMWEAMDGVLVQNGVFFFNEDLSLRFSALNMFYGGGWDFDTTDTASFKLRARELIEKHRGDSNFWDEAV